LRAEDSGFAECPEAARTAVIWFVLVCTAARISASPAGCYRIIVRSVARTFVPKPEMFPDNYRYPATFPTMTGCHLPERHAGAAA
jgi:hypothetical protein